MGSLIQVETILIRMQSMNTANFQQVANNVDLHQKSERAPRNMLVRAMQKQQGHEPCFSTDKRYACNELCEWSADCKKLRAVWLR